jgi:hypothetical protein
MRRRDILSSLSARELFRGLGRWSLLGAAAGAFGATVYYLAGDILRAIFWLLVMGLCARWVGANLEALLRDREESEKGCIPFSVKEIERQERAVVKAWDAAKTLGDSFEDQFAGRTLNDVEDAELIRLNRKFTDLERKAEREAQLRDLMVQANAKVAGGYELLSEARARVLDGYQDAIHEDLLESIKAKKSPP